MVTVAKHQGRARRELHREGSLRLYRYERIAGVDHADAPPVVLVYSFINRPTVLDLLPGRSVVESLQKAGLDVYMVDWGDPGHAEASLDLSGHVERLQRAIAVVNRTSENGRASVLGYCLGGTVALVLGCVAPSLVGRIALLATPVEFGKGGTLAQWANIPTLDPQRLAFNPEGNVPGELLREIFRWLDPMGQVRKWITLAERVEDGDFVENFVAQENWANTCVDFPGVLYAQMMRELYREDRLAKGTLEVSGKKADLAHLDLPVLSLISEGDRIVPNDASLPLGELAPMVKTVKVPGGHIGMTVGRKAVATTHKHLAQFLGGHAS